jgi:DNA-binding CsgD family transcriptional regulator/PAS domain-containing protein
MQPDHLFLRETLLPPADDPDLLSLLELTASLAGAEWVTLDLKLDDSEQAEHFSLGSPEGSGAELDLALEGHFTATLGCPEPLPPSTARMISYALGKTLEVKLLHYQAELLRAALDTTTSAVLLFDQRGAIVYANPPADRLLSRQTEDGLVVEKPGEQPQPLFTLLCSLVDEIARRRDTEPFWHGTLAVSDGEVLACEIVRMQGLGSGQKANVLAIMQTINTLPDRHLSAFAVSYHLTRREEEVLRLLHEGLRTVDIARRLGISRHTVRDHLKNLYRKTGSSSRSELLNQLSSATSVPPPNRRRGSGRGESRVRSRSRAGADGSST